MQLLTHNELRNAVLTNLQKQGYKVDGDRFSLNDHGRETKRNVHFHAKAERVAKSVEFILENRTLIEKYMLDGNELNVAKIEPQVIQIEPNTAYETIYKWWNIVWWSLPYEKAYGRQIRYLIWDKYHNAPIGLIGLQSPILSWKVRDDFLGINSGERDYWVNQSMSAQRLGSLPPYNYILGGKLVASLMTTNKIRDDFALKYNDKRTLIQNRILPARLLFITTTGAYGKSSVYNRLKVNNEYIAKFIGYSKGSGTFHIPNSLFEELVLFLEAQNYHVGRSYGNGPSRKLRLVDVALSKLGIRNGNNHGVQRAVYLFPFASNLREVIKQNVAPEWHDRTIEGITEYWKNRWSIPRSQKNTKYRSFYRYQYMQDTMKEVENMVSYMESQVDSING